MLLRRTAAALSRHFSTTATTKPFGKIPWRYRPRAIHESQKALTEYLQYTRSLPYIYADNIAKNSLQSLSKVVAKIPFSTSKFSYSVRRFLRYHPINELDFFFESIGLHCDDGRIPRTFFLCDWKHFDVACALALMGFPWNKLGLLCRDGFSVFESEPSDLKRRIVEIKDVYGFNNVTLIGICLAFPRVLHGGDDEMDGLLCDLKTLFLDYDLWSCVGGNVDTVYEVCEKIAPFYDMGSEMGKMGEVMGRSKHIFIEYLKEDLVSKIEDFSKFEVRKDEIGAFLLSKPEIFGYDLKNRIISVSGFLEHWGFSGNELESLKQKYPHVFGRNRVANLPGVMRSMDLGEWFFERMKNGDHSLLSTYSICCNEDLNTHYEDNLRKILGKRTHVHAIKKLKFLHTIGFGENRFTVRALALLNSCDRQLYQRFDCLLRCGIEYSKLCLMVKLMPKILNQQESVIERKIEYLCNDMGSSLQYLNVFPGYLCFDLDKRIKPRYKFHKWLVEQGFCRKEYSLSTIIASSEKTYIARLYTIDPRAAMMWQENHTDWAVDSNGLCS